MQNLIRIPARLLIDGIAVFVFYLFKALKPFVFLRIGRLHSGRIGHFSLNTELYLRQANLRDNSRQFDILIARELGRLCNYFLLGMISRKLLQTRRGICLTNRFASRVWDSMRRGFPDADLWFEFPDVPSNLRILNTAAPQLELTEREIRRGKQFLESVGVPPGASFVCFHARDHAYLEKVHRYRPRGEWSYHEHRNCDVKNYLPAARYLASIGIYGLRMGYEVEFALEDEGPLIIDYASHHRSDFGDIFLPAKCKFFLGSEGGLSSVPWTFNVPVAYANAVPGNAGWRSTDIFITKKLWWKEQSRFLRYKEIVDWGADNWGSIESFTEAGLEVIENSSDEILALALEMNGRLDGTWVTTDEDEELQERCRAIFPSGHRCHNYPSRMGSSFLRQNRELID